MFAELVDNLLIFIVLMEILRHVFAYFFIIVQAFLAIVVTRDEQLVAARLT